jgi:hypothetical protein
VGIKMPSRICKILTSEISIDEMIIIDFEDCRLTAPDVGDEFYDQLQFCYCLILENTWYTFT